MVESGRQLMGDRTTGEEHSRPHPLPERGFGWSLKFPNGLDMGKGRSSRPGASCAMRQKQERVDFNGTK